MAVGKTLGLIVVVGGLAALAAAIALFWIVRVPAEDAGNEASAEVVAGERVAPAPTTIPTPAPAIETPAGSQPAPEFAGIVKWLNSEPMEMEAQQGKVVLIDFWTYS